MEVRSEALNAQESCNDDKTLVRVKGERERERWRGKDREARG